MDYKVMTQAVGTNETTYEGGFEQQVDSEVNLPDYCPDIQRILKCTITPKITGVQTAGDRVTADGAALVRVIYVSEDGKVRCYEQNYPFSKYAEMKSLNDGTCISVRAKSDYANCRAISPRRADVHGMVTVSFKATKKKEDKIISGAEGEGIQLRKQNFSATNVIGDVERPFPMSEVIDIGQSKAPVAQIVRSNAVALVNDVKVINNKILIKGELLVSVLYCGDTKQGELEKVEHSMPISQIIEMEGITEDCDSDIHLIVTALDVMPKADSAGEMRLMDISARVCAAIHAGQNLEVPVVIDAYSTKHEMNIDRKTVDFMKLIECFNDTFMSKSSLDMSGMGVSNLLDMWCGDITSNAAVKDDELNITGTVTVHLLFNDKDNQPGYAERPMDFQYKRNLKTPVQRLKCEPAVVTTGCSNTLNSDSRIDARVEFHVSAAVYSGDSDRLIVSLEPNELQEKGNRSGALTIYFSEPGELAWDIARKYNTTVDAVMQENNLGSDTIGEKSMLLIPSV